METGPRAYDPYERRLFYVYTDSGDSIDEILIREGYAVAWTRDGQHRERLMALERSSRAERRGCLW